MDYAQPRASRRSRRRSGTRSTTPRSSAARDRLTGRRFLDLEGPFGIGLTTIEVGNDDYCRQPGPDEAGAILGRAIPVPMLRKSFRLSIRRVAAHIENGQPLDLSPAQDAAEAVADREEELIYSGQPDFRPGRAC